MATSQIPANQIGADFAAPTLVDISELRSAGAVFVSRYLSTAKNHWKVITAGERDAIWGAGLGILLNWEVSTTSWERPGDGTAHAQQAAQQAASLGYPTNLPIIASIDDDVGRAQIEIAAEYLTNFRGALGAYPLGIYGAAPIANQVNDLASFVWATESTAWGTNYHRTPNLQQHSISKFPAFERFRTSNGEPTIDINVTLTAIDVWTSGQDSLMPSPPPTAPPSATPAPHPSAYTVQRGDTLTKIAADHHTTVANLLRANPAISDPNRIMVGQVIKLEELPASGHHTIRAYRTIR